MQLGTGSMAQPMVVYSTADPWGQVAANGTPAQMTQQVVPANGDMWGSPQMVQAASSQASMAYQVPQAGAAQWGQQAMPQVAPSAADPWGPSSMAQAAGMQVQVTSNAPPSTVAQWGSPSMSQAASPQGQVSNQVPSATAAPWGSSTVEQSAVYKPATGQSALGHVATGQAAGGQTGSGRAMSAQAAVATPAGAARSLTGRPPVGGVGSYVEVQGLSVARDLLCRCPPSLDPTSGDDRWMVAAIMHSCQALLQEFQSKGFVEDAYASSAFDKSITGVIHIGAHRGQEAPWYYTQVGSNVVWIECNPSLIPSLAANVAPYGQSCLQACLWRVAGENRTFHLSSNDGQSASIVGNLTDTARAKWAHMSLAGSEKAGYMQLMTTDWCSLANEHPRLMDPSLNLLVLDTQGAEYEILEGMAASRGLGQFQKLLVECSNQQFYEGQRLQTDVDALLASQGFAKAGDVWTNAAFPDHGDVLYVRCGRGLGGSGSPGGQIV